MFRTSPVSSRRNAPLRQAARRAAAVLIEPVERRTLMSAGALDPTFGAAGTITRGGELYDLAIAAADANGREIVAYNESGVHGGDATVTRLNADGSTDTTFGTNGFVTVGTGPDTTDYPNEGGVQVSQVIPLPNGDVLLAGTTIQELTSTGALDTRFGGGGPNDVGRGSGYLYPAVGGNSVAVQADGKLVTDGEAGSDSVVVARYNADGSIDTTYGTGGQITITPTPAGSSSGYLSALGGPTLLDAAGRAIVSFAATVAERPDGLGASSVVEGTFRLTTTGQVDTSYGAAGVAVSPVFDGGLSSASIAMAADGTLYQAIDAVPYGATTGVSHLFVYSADGRHVAAAVVSGAGSVTDVAVGTDGKPVLSTSDGRVDRLLPINPAASPSAVIVLDPTWAASGSAIIAYPPLTYTPIASRSTFGADTVSYDGKGNLIVTSSGGGQMAVSRLLATGPSSVVPVAATGTVIGSAGSYANQGNTVAKAFDGNLNTFYDAAQATGGWAGLDLGTAAQPIVQIQFAPRAGFAARMVGGQFQVSSTPDFSGDVRTIYTVTSTPVVGSLTTVAVGDIGGAYRYVRYLGPTGGYGNIAEMKVLVAGPSVLTGTVIGTAGSYANQGNTIANAFDGNLNTFVDASAASGGWAGLDLGYPRSVSQVSFAPRAGWAARMVGGQFQASNTADFSGGVVTLYTITAVPTVGQLTTVSVNPAAAGIGFRYVRYIGPAGSYDNIAEADFLSGPPVKQAGTVIGTAGSYLNQGNTTAHAVDGNLKTFFDGPDASGDYVGVDLGTAIAIDQIKVAPRTYFGSRMIGGTIVASNISASGLGFDAVTMYTFTSAPPDGTLTTITLNNTTAYRYWFYVGPNGSYCNIAELEFDA